MGFGGFIVLHDISINIHPGEIVGVLGPNGAGKTTWMNLLTGALRPISGRVVLSGEDVTRVGADQRCRKGLALTHQMPRPFGGMTVIENVLVGMHHGRAHRVADPVATAWSVLEETGLAHLANRQAETLGLMDRKRLELARALGTDPVVLLLDEIGGGLTDAEGDALVELILEIHARGVTIVWVEHVMRLLLAACTRMVCMAEGVVLADGAPQTVIEAPEVRAAYFGAAA